MEISVRQKDAFRCERGIEERERENRENNYYYLGSERTFLWNFHPEVERIKGSVVSSKLPLVNYSQRERERERERKRERERVSS